MSSSRRWATTSSNDAARPRRPNVLLVSLDTVRADVAYAGNFPTFARFDATGVRFQTAVSTSPITPVSHGTVLTGLFPFNHGVRHLLRDRLRTNVPTLATALRSAGYATGAVVASAAVNRWYGLDRGFDFYDDEIPALARAEQKAIKRAPDVAERAAAWSTSIREPYLLFVHFFDAHWPYQPPVAPVAAANPYEGEVEYLQSVLGELLDDLGSSGRFGPDDLLVAFADHGEDLGGLYPNDHVGDARYPEEQTHGCLLFDVTQLVPLWFVGGGCEGGRTVPTQVRLADVLPTVLELVDCRAVSTDGASLVPLLRGERGRHRDAYCETYFREEIAAQRRELPPLKPLKAVRVADRYKAIWEVDSERVDLYDLRSDPYEREPRVDGALPPAVARSVRRFRPL